MSIVVRTGGTSREIGCDIGIATKEVVRALIAEHRRFYDRQTRIGYAAAKRIAMRRYLPAAQETYPAHVEELRAIAEGAGVPFEDLLPFSAEEELRRAFPMAERCTTAAIPSKHGMVIAHNEDYLRRYAGKLVLAIVEPRRGPAFVSLGYPGTLAGSACGINACGIAFGGDSLQYRPARSGIPKNFVLRDLFASRSLADLGGRAARGPRLVSHAVVAADGAQALAVEMNLRDSAAMVAEDAALCHANHVITALPKRGEHPARDSFRRVRACETACIGRRAIGMTRLRAVLTDPYGGLLMRRTDHWTLASVIMDPLRLTMQVADHGQAPARWRTYRVPGSEK